MFTRNWYYGMAACLAYYNNAEGLTTSIFNVLKNFSGASPSSVGYTGSWSGYLGAETTSPYAPTVYYVQTSMASNGGVIFGTGTTPPTIDDYCLSGDLITNFTYSKQITKIFDSDGLTITGLYTITNPGSSAFTIGEIGLMAGSGAGKGETYKCLLERTVLDNPVTIPAGGVGQVTYTIRMNYPT